MKFDASFFLRVGLAFVFLFAAISGFTNPQAWIGYVPELPFGNFITQAFALLVHDIVMFILGLWLLSGKKIYYAAIVSAVLLAGITLANLGALLITFRDVGLFFAAVALALISKEKR